MNNLNLILGASNHTSEERQHLDYYATDPVAMEAFLRVFNPSQMVWECACGGGHLAEVLKNHGHFVYSTDIEDRGCCDDVINFLEYEGKFDGDIITNPPFKHATEFIRKGLEVVEPGRRVIMLLKIQFLEGKDRRALFMESPPKEIYVSTSRIKIAKDGDFERYAKSTGSMCYAWFVWEKGVKQPPVIKWFN